MKIATNLKIDLTFIDELITINASAGKNNRTYLRYVATNMVNASVFKTIHDEVSEKLITEFNLIDQNNQSDIAPSLKKQLLIDIQLFRFQTTKDVPEEELKKYFSVLKNVIELLFI